jgi:hypothetical protein
MEYLLFDDQSFWSGKEKEEKEEEEKGGRRKVGRGGQCAAWVLGGVNS